MINAMEKNLRMSENSFEEPPRCRGCDKHSNSLSPVIHFAHADWHYWQVVDNMLPDLICSDKSQPLEPQGSISCAASYKLKQDDVDSGIVTNQVQIR